jgi:hypothetical protein
MGRYYWVHALSDCEFCIDAVKLLNQTGFQYILSLYDRSLPALQATKKIWSHDSTPIIVEYRVSGESELIGGYTDLVEYFTDQGFMPEITETKEVLTAYENPTKSKEIG